MALLIASLLLPELPPPSPASVEIAGIYEVIGETPGGIAYTGVGLIEKLGQNYRVSWILGGDNGAARGLAMREGRTVYVAFAAGGSVGLMRLEVSMLQGRVLLKGSWAIGEETGKETWRRLE